MKQIEFRSMGPISSALDLIGDKWSLLIVRDMMFFNKKYFTEFEKSSEAISSNILSNRLVKLCEQGIVTKSADPKNKKKYIYKMTEKGIDLLPTMVEIILWSDEYLNISNEAREFAASLRNQKEGIIKQLKREILSQ